jgi:hypothetical protein
MAPLSGKLYARCERLCSGQQRPHKVNVARTHGPREVTSHKWRLLDAIYAILGSIEPVGS